MIVEQAQLLHEGHQAGREIQIQMPLLGFLVQVQDVVVLAVSIAVEVAVRIVEQHRAGVLLGEQFVAFDGLLERSGILEREATFGERIAEPHPRAGLAAARAAVSFVDQDQVVVLEGVDGDGLVAHVLTQLMDVDDLDGLPREEAASVLVEDLGLDARSLQLFEVLPAEVLVRGDEDDAVQISTPTVLLEVVLILKNVGVHEKRLAGAGRAPECEPVELRPGFLVGIER